MGVDLGRKRKRQVSGLPNELGHRQYPPHPNPWAEDDPRKYWEAADTGERANGRLYREVEFALPRELNAAERVELATRFAEHLTGEERLPYTLAIHRGGQDGGNPHAHLMFSERANNDGIERSAAQWFKRYNAKEPEKGGARKSTATKPRDWLEQTREDWADQANAALDRAGRTERINEASFETQYFEAAENGDEREMARLQNRGAGGAYRAAQRSAGHARRGPGPGCGGGGRGRSQQGPLDRGGVGASRAANPRGRPSGRGAGTGDVEPGPRSRYRGKVMADAMDRVRAAEARYQEVIERTTTLDRHITELDTHLANLRWTAEKTVEVLSNLRSELEREGRAAKERSERIEQANRVPLPIHRWFFPVVFTAYSLGYLVIFCGRLGIG